MCTDEFYGLGHAEAEALGMVTMPMVVVTHPMGGLRADEVHARADAAVEEIARALTVAREVLAEENRNREVPSRRAIREKPLFA